MNTMFGGIFPAPSPDAPWAPNTQNRSTVASATEHETITELPLTCLTFTFITMGYLSLSSGYFQVKQLTSNSFTIQTIPKLFKITRHVSCHISSGHGCVLRVC